MDLFALTEIARTGHRYIRPIVIRRKRAFPPLFLRSETEQRKRAKREKRKIIASKMCKNCRTQNLVDS